ncbi:MAG: response regulator transcription factor [Bacteroidales bacterium]
MEIAKVVIVDDHIIFRKGLLAILNEIDNVKVVGEASNGNELLDLLKKQDTDIIFMDIKMPIGAALKQQKVLAKYRDKIIALTMFEEISYFNEMIEAGASGFLLKKTSTEELQKAIELVLIDESYFSEEFMSSVNKYIKPKQKDSTIALTDQEIEVLELICKSFRMQTFQNAG